MLNALIRNGPSDREVVTVAVRRLIEVVARLESAVNELEQRRAAH